MAISFEISGAKRQQWRIPRPLLILLVLGAVLRIAWLVSFPRVIETEGPVYAGIAQRVLEGRTYIDHTTGLQVGFPPLYPLLIGSLSFVTRDLEIAGRVASLVMGLGLIVAVFYLARQLYGERTASIAGTFVALYPVFIMLSGSCYSEATYLTLLVSGAFWGVQSLQGKGAKVCFLAGILFGLAYLTRLEGIIYPFLTATAIAAAAWIERRGWKQPFLACMAVVGAFTVMATPYVIFLSHHTGHLTWEGKGTVQYTMGRRMNSGMHEGEAEYGTDEQLTDAGPQLNHELYAREHSPVKMGEFFRYSLQAAKRNRDAVFHQVVLSLTIGSPMLAVLVVLGLLGKPWSREQTLPQIYLAVLALSVLAIMLVIFRFEFRFGLPLLPFLVIWASNGVEQFADWAEGTVQGFFFRGSAGSTSVASVARWGICAVVLGLTIMGSRYLVMFTIADRYHLPIKEAGLWLRNKPCPRVVMDVSAIIAFYADTSVMPMPWADSSLALRYIAKKNPNYIVLNGISDLQARPYSEDWLRHGIPDPRAELVYRTGTTPNTEVVIYRWKKQAQQ